MKLEFELPIKDSVVLPGINSDIDSVELVFYQSRNINKKNIQQCIKKIDLIVSHYYDPAKYMNIRLFLERRDLWMQSLASCFRMYSNLTCKFEDMNKLEMIEIEEPYVEPVPKPKVNRKMELYIENRGIVMDMINTYFLDPVETPGRVLTTQIYKNSTCADRVMLLKSVVDLVKCPRDVNTFVREFLELENVCGMEPVNSNNKWIQSTLELKYACINERKRQYELKKQEEEEKERIRELMKPITSELVKNHWRDWVNVRYEEQRRIEHEKEIEWRRQCAERDARWKREWQERQARWSDMERQRELTRQQSILADEGRIAQNRATRLDVEHANLIIHDDNQSKQNHLDILSTVNYCTIIDKTLLDDAFCSVCQDSIEWINDECLTDPTPVMTPCNHYFHAKCLSVWLNIKRFCPNCIGAM